MRPEMSIAERLAHKARNDRDAHELRVAHQKEVDATRSLFVSLRSKLGSESKALEELKRRGFNCNLLP